MHFLMLRSICRNRYNIIYTLNKPKVYNTSLSVTKTKINQNLNKVICNIKTFFKTPNGGRSKFSLTRLSLAVPLVATSTKLSKNAFINQYGKDEIIIQPLEEETKFDFNLLLKFLKDEVYLLLVAVCSALVVAFLNIKIPMCLGDLVNIVTRFFNSNTDLKFLEEIQYPILKLLGLFFAQSFFTFMYISSLSLAGEHMAKKLREELFASILKQDISFFDEHRNGEIISRLTTDIQDFKSSFKLIISQGLRSFAQITGSIISIYLISPKMTSLVVIILPAFIGIGTLLGSTLRKLSRKAQEQVAKATALADEAIANIRTVRAFAMEDKELELYRNEIDKVESLNCQLGLGIGGFQSLTNLALNGIVLGVIGTGGYLISSQDLTPGSLMSFLIATQNIQKSLAQVSLLFGHCVKGVASGTRVFEFIKCEPTNPLRGGKTIAAEHLQGNIEFKDVSFSYPTRADEKVLDGLNLKLGAGKMIAVCGLSGGGKSTIAALLEKFYDVNSGSIEVDGINVNDLDASWLRSHVLGYISQEPILFATSILENIRYGRPDATDSEVIEAAKLANADDFIRNFANGYQTVLGERGVTISGGQKQRIAIARALIKDPKVLILDEATSALDAESEKAVQEALTHVVKGRTVLVIAHRLSSIQNADEIIVLSNGCIVESGTHSALLKKKGLYWELIKHQQMDEFKNKKVNN